MTTPHNDILRDASRAPRRQFGPMTKESQEAFNRTLEALRRGAALAASAETADRGEKTPK